MDGRNVFYLKSNSDFNPRSYEELSETIKLGGTEQSTDDVKPMNTVGYMVGISWSVEKVTQAT